MVDIPRRHHGKLGGGIGLYYFENDKTYFSDLYTIENLNKYTKFERIFGIGYFKKKYNFNMIFHSFSEIQHILKYFSRNKKKEESLFYSLFYLFFTHSMLFNLELRLYQKVHLLWHQYSRLYQKASFLQNLQNREM